MTVYCVKENLPFRESRFVSAYSSMRSPLQAFVLDPKTSKWTPETFKKRLSTLFLFFSLLLFRRSLSVHSSVLKGSSDSLRDVTSVRKPLWHMQGTVRGEGNISLNGVQDIGGMQTSYQWCVTNEIDIAAFCHFHF